MVDNITQPIGTLVGIGVMAYGAKKVIDLTTDQAKQTKQQVQTKKPQAFNIENKIQRMLQ